MILLLFFNIWFWNGFWKGHVFLNTVLYRYLMNLAIWHLSPIRENCQEETLSKKTWFHISEKRRPLRQK